MITDNIMIGECDFCGYETSLEKSFIKNAEREEANLCEVCSSTFAGNAYHYPKQYDCSGVMKQISYIANMILDIINPQRKPYKDTIKEDE